MGMRVSFTSETIWAVLTETAASAHEVCGLLRGSGDRIERAEPARNVAADPARHFEIDPAVLLKAYRDARNGGPTVLGCYHSHPGGSADPSATDAEQAAADGRLWLIVGRGTARLWRAVANGERHGRFDPVSFDVLDAGHVEKSCRAVHMDASGRTLTFAAAQGSSL